jgi:GAF domain
MVLVLYWRHRATSNAWRYVQYTIDIEPTDELEARISLVVEANDWVDAMRASLSEIGLGDAEIGSAACEVLEEGIMRIRDPKTGRVYRVTEQAEAQPVEIETVELFSPAPVEAANVQDKVAPLATDIGVVTPSPSDEELLDESLLERYFDDDLEEEEVREELRRQAFPRVEAEEGRTVVAATPARDARGHDDAESRVGSTEVDGRLEIIDTALKNLREYGDALDDAADFACFSLLDPLRCEVVSLLLLDKKQKTLQFGGIAGEAPARLRKFRYPRGLGLPWVALDQGMPLMVNHVERDERFHEAVARKTGFRVNATILAPVSFKGRGYGVLQAVRSASGAEGFTDADLAILEAAATHVGDYLTYFETF